MAMPDIIESMHAQEAWDGFCNAQSTLVSWEGMKLPSSQVGGTRQLLGRAQPGIYSDLHQLQASHLLCIQRRLGVVQVRGRHAP